MECTLPSNMIRRLSNSTFRHSKVVTLSNLPAEVVFFKDAHCVISRLEAEFDTSNTRVSVLDGLSFKIQLKLLSPLGILFRVRLFIQHEDFSSYQSSYPTEPSDRLSATSTFLDCSRPFYVILDATMWKNSVSSPVLQWHQNSKGPADNKTKASRKKGKAPIVSFKR